MARPIVARNPPLPRARPARSRPQRVVRRGRRFFRLYLGLLGSAAAAFGVLVFLVRDRQEALLRLDERISRAVQGVNVPGYGWVLTHVSDLGYPPLHAVAYVAVFVAFCAVRRYREAALAVVSSLLADLVGAGIRESGRATAPFRYPGARGAPYQRLRLPVRACDPVRDALRVCVLRRAGDLAGGGAARRDRDGARRARRARRPLAGLSRGALAERHAGGLSPRRALAGGDDRGTSRD